MTSTDDRPTQTTRVPLRLRMSDPERPAALDGGWWPQSRDLSVEMADLIDSFPESDVRITRANFSPPDWDTPPKRVTTARGYVDVTAFAHEFSPVVIVTTSDRRKLCLLVIPPDLTEEQGQAALEAAVTPRFAPSPTLLLRKIIDGSAD